MIPDNLLEPCRLSNCLRCRHDTQRDSEVPSLLYKPHDFQSTPSIIEKLHDGVLFGDRAGMSDTGHDRKVEDPENGLLFISLSTYGSGNFFGLNKLAFICSESQASELFIFDLKHRRP